MAEFVSSGEMLGYNLGEGTAVYRPFLLEVR
jgi:hypothetical protein